jgi:hypothetical protein
MSVESKRLITALDDYLERYLAHRYPKASTMEYGIKIANQRDVVDARAILEIKLDEFLSFTPILADEIDLNELARSKGEE